MASTMKGHLMSSKSKHVAKQAKKKKTASKKKKRVMTKIKTKPTDAGELRKAEIVQVKSESPSQTLKRHYVNRIANTFRVWALSKLTHDTGRFSDIFKFAASHQLYLGSNAQGKQFNIKMSSVWEGNVDAAHTFGAGLEEKRDIKDPFYDSNLKKAVARVDLIPSNINSQGGLDVKFDEMQYEFMKSYYDKTALRNYDIFSGQIGKKSIYVEYEEYLKKLVDNAKIHYGNADNKPNIMAVNSLETVLKTIKIHEEALRREMQDILPME